MALGYAYVRANTIILDGKSGQHFAGRFVLG